MASLVSSCPRCNASNMTFEVKKSLKVSHKPTVVAEVFCVCHHCHRSTVFEVAQKRWGDDYVDKGLENFDRSINAVVYVKGYISIRNLSAQSPPQHLPEGIESVFNEGATCLAVGCYNAAAAMFRLCLDLATKSKLLKYAEKPNASIQRSLGQRLDWLFDKEGLPKSLRELSTCIKDYGNDGAHEGTLSKEDAEDIFDFTYHLLERLYTEPAKLEQANRRRESRKRKDDDS